MKKDISLSHIRNPDCRGPFWSVYDISNKSDDNRALWCGQLALLNLRLNYLNLSGIEYSAAEEVEKLSTLITLSGPITHGLVLETIKGNPEFFGCHNMISFFISYFDKEEFLYNLLNLLRCHFPILLHVYIPDDPTETKQEDSANHTALLYYQDGNVYLDSQEVDIEFLLEMIYFHPHNFFTFIDPFGVE